jgi:hypothetical protein
MTYGLICILDKSENATQLAAITVEINQVFDTDDHIIPGDDDVIKFTNKHIA